ncbi:unnamed protein product [Withania somnifera]
MAKKNSLITLLICIFLLVNLCSAIDKGLDWWWHPYWFRFHPHPWPFVHPPMSGGGFRYRFPHPWPFMHPPKSSSSEEVNN